MADRTRIVLVGAVIPAIVVLIGVLLVAVSLPVLPDPIAIHWGASGQADGYGPVWANLVLLPLLVGGYCVFALVAVRGEGFSLTQRMLVVTAPFLAVLLSFTLAGSVWIQRGLDDAAQAPNILPLLLTGAALGIAVVVGSWFVLPRTTAPDEEGEDAPPLLALGATERVVWMRRLGPSGLVVGLFAGTLALLGAVVVVALVLAAPPLVAALYTGLVVLVVLLGVSTMFWRVRVSDRGLEVRSALGIPRYSVALDEIDTASRIEVEPVRDFGGWGLRWGGPGRFGVITQRGEALEVRRRNGKVFIVTVPGATTAAALLNALVARHGTMS